MGKIHKLKVKVKEMKEMIEAVVEIDRQLLGVVAVHKQEIATLQASNLALAAGMETITKNLLTPDTLIGYQ